ncbi:hypothetical protein [Metabacillus fastidiosus]|uniref:hypothetical protein n=1 Tax=Metabacillus fastidiosus TaxID=1458 RepID=UPI003D2C6C99
MNEFSIKEKVVVNGKKDIGEIKQIEEKKMIYEDGRVERKYQYLIEMEESLNRVWYHENELKHYLNDEASVNKALINAYLLTDLEYVKHLKMENDVLENKTI